jgi:hypothetical protein
MSTKQVAGELMVQLTAHTAGLGAVSHAGKPMRILRLCVRPNKKAVAAGARAGRGDSPRRGCRSATVFIVLTGPPLSALMHVAAAADGHRSL